MSTEHQLLSELLRPQQLGDLTLPQRDIERLQGMVSAGQIMNMIFCGLPGVGKTSTANILIRLLDADSLTLNGSADTGISHIREVVGSFANSVSMTGSPKICFIDDADFLSKNAQAALRQLIEITSDNCRYLFTVNEIRKIDPAIRSRMQCLCFDILPTDRPDVLKRMNANYEAKLAALGIRCPKKRLTEIIGIYFPDFRRIATQIQWEFGLPHSKAEATIV